MQMSERNSLLIDLQNELTELVAMKVGHMERIFNIKFTKEELHGAFKAAILGYK